MIEITIFTLAVIGFVSSCMYLEEKEEKEKEKRLISLIRKIIDETK